jgi:hypothetical protein
MRSAVWLLLLHRVEASDEIVSGRHPPKRAPENEPTVLQRFFNIGVGYDGWCLLLTRRGSQIMVQHDLADRGDNRWLCWSGGWQRVGTIEE